MIKNYNASNAHLILKAVKSDILALAKILLCCNLAIILLEDKKFTRTSPDFVLIKFCNSQVMGNRNKH